MSLSCASAVKMAARRESVTFVVTTNSTAPSEVSAAILMPRVKVCNERSVIGLEVSNGGSIQRLESPAQSHGRTSAELTFTTPRHRYQTHPSATSSTSAVLDAPSRAKHEHAHKPHHMQRLQMTARTNLVHGKISSITPASSLLTPRTTDSE